MRGISFSLIAQTIAAHYNVTAAQLRGPQLTQTICEARGICFYLARKHLGQSSSVVAAWFGDRDHTTVLRGAKIVAERIKIDAAFAEHIRAFETDLSLLARAKVVERFINLDARALARRLLQSPRDSISASVVEIETLALRVTHDDAALLAAADLLGALADPARAFNDAVLGDLAGALAGPLEALGYVTMTNTAGDQEHG